MGAVSCGLVMVTAADRAAATCQRLSPVSVYKWGPEGGGGKWKAARRAPSTTSPPQRRNPLDSLHRGICHTPSRTTAYAPHSFVDILPLRRYNSLDRRISRRSRAVARRDARWARVKGIGCDLRTIPVTVKRTRKHSHCSIPEWEGAFEVEAKSGDLAASQHIAISWG